MQEQENKLGAPTLYKPEYDKQAYKLCLLGATDKDLGDFFEVDERTINNWKKAHPSFFQSIKSGKVEADAIVSESLFKSAKGHALKEITYERTDADMDTDSEDGTDTMFEVWKKKVVVKEIAPNPTSAIFWLKNRQPDKWRDKQELKVEGDLTVVWNEEKTYEAEQKADNSNR